MYTNQENVDMKINNIIIVLSFLLTSLISVSSYARVIELSTSGCSRLANPNTVVVIYDRNCSHCHEFLPVYERVSNEPEFSGWTFYKHEINSGDICNAGVTEVPTIFKNNMSERSTGVMSAGELRSFLKD
jgi:hypothetical protein